MNHPRLTEYYFTGTLFSSTKGIRGDWWYQVLYGKKSLFGDVYEIVTEIHGREKLEILIGEYDLLTQMLYENVQM